MADLNIPQDLKYAESDEWIRVNGDIITIGISDYAQDALNDIVYIELRSIATTIEKGESFGEIESVKAASELYTPVAGEIVEVNGSLVDDPETINSDPYGAGWMVRIRMSDPSGLDVLMDAAAYASYCAGR